MEQHARHTCLIYAGAPSELLPAIGSLLIEKLNAGYRCMYVNSTPMVNGLRSFLTGAGIDVKTQIERGALEISSDRDYLAKGIFEVEPMIAMLRTAAQRAPSDGYKGLWASGDMTWELAGEKNVAKLFKYECRLEELFYEIPTLTGCCQYHMDTLPGSAIQNALYAHPGIYTNETLAKMNPNYLPPETPAERRPKPSQSALEEMLERLGLPSFPRKAGATFE